MTRLTRYILRQCFGVMVFVTAALSAAVWMAQSLPLIDLIVNRGLSLDVFLYLAALIMPRFLDIVLPIGIFIAVLFTFNRLTAESELVVMRAAGLSPMALARPVLILAAIAFAILMSLSLYVLPVSSRAFKDLQFEIRNRFVSSLIQEGTFTTISDKLTFYIRSREANGDVVGLLINDSRDPQRPITILAQRAAFVDTAAGSRIVMLNGNRQQFDPQTHKLSVLTFQRYTLDLESMQDAPVVRFRGAQERFLGELLFPPAGLDALVRRSFIMEAHQRLLIPLSALSFSLIPLACLLPGEFSRRGQAKRVIVALGAAFLFQVSSLGVNDLAARFTEAIPLMYVVDLLPFAVGLTILLNRGIRFGFRWPGYAAARAI
ncbi:MAG TPA: LPS export ABC transporter permease LptF [Stellaceae bacterium]|nr:LPS export ABC transporter permease LptF [Stellaceae bacterium]